MGILRGIGVVAAGIGDEICGCDCANGVFVPSDNEPTTGNGGGGGGDGSGSSKAGAAAVSVAIEQISSEYSGRQAGRQAGSRAT